MNKFFLRAGIACAIAVAGSAVFASGTESSSGGQSSDTQLYNQGKSIYANKLACSGCTMANKSLDAKAAKELLSDSSKSKQLSADENKALSVYLTKRFRL